MFQKIIFSVFTFFIISLCFLNCSSDSSHSASQTPQHQKDTYPIPQDKGIFNGTGQKGGKLILDLTGNLETFNPIVGTTDHVSKVFKDSIYQTLMNSDLKTLEYTYLLARSMEILNDGKTLRFKLRRGVRWSDGTPFTMADVKFTYELIKDPKVETRLQSILKQEDGSYPAVKYIDDETVEFTSNKVNALFPGMIASIYILPKHKWGKAYRDGQFMQTLLSNSNPKDVVGTGPFVLDSYLPDQRAVLKRNPYYWRFDKDGKRLPYLDKIVRLIVPDTNTSLVKFQNGETDMYKILPEQYDLLKRDEDKLGYKIFDLGPDIKRTYLMPNQNTGKNKNNELFVKPHKLKLFSDKRFRQALSYAIDRNGINKTIYHGRGYPVYAFNSPGNKQWYNPNTKKYPFDLEKAKALLKDIGLKDSNGDGILEYPDLNEPIRLTIKTNSESKERGQIANLIKEDFKKIGLDVSVQIFPFVSLVNVYKHSLDYDFIISGWAGGVPPDPIMSKNIFLHNAGSHYWNLNQKEKPATEWEARIHELMFLNEQTVNMEERIKYWHEVESIWAEQLPQIMIAAPTTYVAIKNKIGNARPVNLRPYYEWNIDELYIKK